MVANLLGISNVDPVYYKLPPYFCFSYKGNRKPDFYIVVKNDDTKQQFLNACPELEGDECFIIDVNENLNKLVQSDSADQFPIEDLAIMYAISAGEGLTEAGKLIAGRDSIDKMKIPVFREDIFTSLVIKGIPEETAFDITEFVRKGKAYCGIEAGNEKLLATWGEYKSMMTDYNIPGWYIEYLEKIRYMVSKSQALSYSRMVGRILLD